MYLGFTPFYGTMMPSKMHLFFLSKARFSESSKVKSLMRSNSTGMLAALKTSRTDSSSQHNYESASGRCQCLEWEWHAVPSQDWVCGLMRCTRWPESQSSDGWVWKKCAYQLNNNYNKRHTDVVLSSILTSITIINIKTTNLLKNINKYDLKLTIIDFLLSKHVF